MPRSYHIIARPSSAPGAGTASTLPIASAELSPAAQRRIQAGLQGEQPWGVSVAQGTTLGCPPARHWKGPRGPAPAQPASARRHPRNC